MEDETDLSELANLDIIDDSTPDFWNLNPKEESLESFDNGFNEYLNKSSELNWNTPTTKTTHEAIPAALPTTPSYGNKGQAHNLASSPRKRSDSLSSDNSLTSQSTVTQQYGKYGMTPMIYPSESSSSSSRPLSRLSNYSASSMASSSGISHHPRSNGTGIPTPSRSYTSKKGSKVPRVPLSKRASHIPAPASHHSPPAPQKTLSSSSTSSRKSRIPNQRSSHIPTLGTQRPESPSRMGMRSPTPGSRLFAKTDDKKRIFSNSNTNTTTNSRSSGLRPPTATNSNGRSVSRIGTLKKT
ncbi:hypothetical protein BY458DRAFT_524939 [Sporodiniella umbellata]|nr:hypothetical protein BY458DRAFT_524939 [Sporodiniella umbellata]